MPVAAKELLLGLHARLRVRLDHVEGGPLQVKLESGVLQGGGTGPRLFRIAYDTCIQAWKHDACQHDLAVQYLGHTYPLSTAAYAEDLVRIVCGTSLDDLDLQTGACARSLHTCLDPCGLKLNHRKGETLLCLRGQGAYESSRRAFSGGWGVFPQACC